MTISGRHPSHRGYTGVVRQICRIAVFPVALVVAVASAMAAMDRGVDPVAAMFSVYLAGMVVVTALERLFSWIFSVGELHRWHHSTRMHEANRNYGNTFIIWDAVFGTRFLPSDRSRPEAVGIEGLAAFPQSLPAQFLAPFRWRRIEEASEAVR